MSSQYGREGGGGGGVARARRGSVGGPVPGDCHGNVVSWLAGDTAGRRE